MDKTRVALILLAVVLIGWNIYRGATVRKIGIPAIFEIKFGEERSPTPGPSQFPSAKQMDVRINAGTADTRCGATPPSAASMVQLSAPAKAKLQKGAIVTDRFVETEGSSSVNGVRVSQDNATADFKHILDCGGRFVYIRLSYGSDPWNETQWRYLWARSAAVEKLSSGASTKAASLLRGAYHQLAFSVSALSAKDDETVRKDAAKQAHQFVSRFFDVLALTDDQATLPVALAVLPGSKPQGLSPLHKERYRAGVCSWLRETKDLLRVRSETLLIHSSPTWIEALGLTDLPCDEFRNPKLWLQAYTAEGDTASAMNERVRSLCGTNGNSRCVFHEYTPYGIFSVQGSTQFVGLVRFLGDSKRLEAIKWNIKNG